MVVLHARADARAHRFTTLAMISPAAPTVFAIEPMSIGLCLFWQQGNLESQSHVKLCEIAFEMFPTFIHIYIED